MELLAYKEIFVPEAPEGGIVNGAISYTSREGMELIHIFGVVVGSDRYDLFKERFSPDNGLSWSQPVEIREFKSSRGSGGVWRCCEISLFLDEKTDTLLRFFGKGFYPDDVPKMARPYLFYQVFDRNKKAWSSPREVKGEADSGEVFPGVEEGSLSISCSYPIRTRYGKILVPAQVKFIDENGNIRFPFPNYFSPFYEPIVLLGELYKGEVYWEAGEKVSIDPNVSCRLCEPTVAELSDGRLVMICRGDNGAFPQRPGYKWLSMSDDGGYRWTPPRPLTFTGGERLYSPSSCSYLFRSRKTGKLYWIANVLDRNPVGNRPRYPLVISEFDEEELAVVKESMFTIDDRGPGEPETVQLSNFRCYQDRVTGDLVLLMARYGEKKDDWRRSPLYIYRIKLD
ncbi:exo-alpha-sialidase [Candidatus Bathyarchaeota archaeon]|nr:MAG: exo-alpha-sialidase [Candidatus Bathyarchaeota archaeon]